MAVSGLYNVVVDKRRGAAACFTRHNAYIHMHTIGFKLDVYAVYDSNNAHRREQSLQKCATRLF
jgi:hypothetical protein